MALVSGFYKLAPSEWSGADDERRVRAHKAVSKVIARLGLDAVRDAIDLKLYCQCLALGRQRLLRAEGPAGT